MPENLALRRALEARGLTHRDCAERAHVARETVTRACTGERPPRRVVAEAIAQVLDVPSEVLFPDARTSKANH